MNKMYRFLPILVIVAVLIFSFSYIPIKREIFYKLGISNDTTTSCCKLEEISKNGNFDESATIAIFNGGVIDYPKTSLAQNQTFTNLQLVVLGTTNANGEEKWIEISLSEQKLRAWEGNRIVMEYSISGGKWAPTPKGDFRIWYKTKNQRMRGGSKELGTFYDLPNVPHNMFFNGPYAVHGAYWHNNFGQPMSHGCVNEPLDKAAWLFEWAGPILPEGINALRASSDNPGTRVFVH